MAAQVGLAKGGACLVVGVGEFGHLDVGLDPALLHRATGRGEIARGGEPQRRVLPQRDQRLHRPLAEAALAHDQRAVLVLERARDDLARRGGARIGEHDHGQAVRVVAGLGG